MVILSTQVLVIIEYRSELACLTGGCRRDQYGRGGHDDVHCLEGGQSTPSDEGRYR